MSLRQFVSKYKHLAPPAAKPLLRWTLERFIRTLRFFTPGRLPQNPHGEIYLNLGAGSATHPAFINIDAYAAFHTHYIQAIDKLANFSTGSVDLIYASHCLEHFSHRQTAQVLTEWHRVLKTGGVLRIGVPNFDSLVHAYEAGGRDIELIQGVLSGGQDYPLNVHLRSFTHQSLSRLLEDAGFKTVRPWQHGDGELKSISDCCGLHFDVAGQRIAMSLNLEGVK
jgi:predicted SAM-dependent methyltransferase